MKKDRVHPKTTQDYTKQDNTRDTAQTQEGDIKVFCSFQ